MAQQLGTETWQSLCPGGFAILLVCQDLAWRVQTLRVTVIHGDPKHIHGAEMQQLAPGCRRMSHALCFDKLDVRRTRNNDGAEFLGPTLPGLLEAVVESSRKTEPPGDGSLK